VKLLRPDMKRLVMDLTPCRWRDQSLTEGPTMEKLLKEGFKNVALLFAGIGMDRFRSLEEPSRVMFAGGYIAIDSTQHTFAASEA
jgi:hypothetical protein